MFSIVVAVGIGAVAGLIAYLIVRLVPSLQEQGGKAVGGLAVLLMLIGNQALGPPIKAWKMERDVDALLRDDPMYSTILADHPEVREPLRSGLLQATRQAKPGEAAAQVGAKVLGPILPKYLARTTDEALLGFVTVTVARLEQLRPDPNRCYAFLFPAQGGAPVPTKDERAEDLQKAVRDVVVAARGRASSRPAEAAVGPTLQRVFTGLASRHGADVGILQQAQAPGVDRAKVCALAIDLYSTINALPPGESAPTLRFILGQS